MATGDSSNSLTRIARLFPARWFAASAPIRDAVVGGVADALAWIYSFVAFVKTQSRLATATGMFIDLWAFDYLGLSTRRKTQEGDTSFRTRVQNEVLRQRVTRYGMAKALYDLTGQTPVIFEPWNSGDSGGWNIGPCAWGTNASFSDDFSDDFADETGGAGGWGSTLLPSQALITVYVNSDLGVSGIGGWASGAGSSATSGAMAWDSGSDAEWITTTDVPGAITAQDIYDVINATKPEGVICWVRIIEGASPLAAL